MNRATGDVKFGGVLLPSRCGRGQSGVCVNWRRGVTLIELLAVLSIIMVMLAIAIPAIVTINKSEGVNQAARQVSTALLMARSDAIANRRRVRLVFLGSAANIASGTDDFSKVYRTYTVVAKTDSTLADTRTDSWSFTDKWEYLPTGIVFASGSLDSLPSFSDALTLSGTGNAIMNYIEFRPSGRAYISSGQSSATLTMTEGVVLGTANTATTAFTNINNRADLSWDRFIGRVRVIQP